MIIGVIKVFIKTTDQCFKDRQSFTMHEYVDCTTEDNIKVTGIMNENLFRKHEYAIMKNHYKPDNYFYAIAEIKNFATEHSNYSATNLILSIKDLIPCSKDDININLFSVRGLAIKCNEESDDEINLSTIACNKVIMSKGKKDIKKSYAKIKTKEKLNMKDDVFGSVKLSQLEDKLIIEELFIRHDFKYFHAIAENNLL